MKHYITITVNAARWNRFCKYYLKRKIWFLHRSHELSKGTILYDTRKTELERFKAFSNTLIDYDTKQQL